MKKLKEFRIAIWEEHSGYMTVKAKNKKEAEEKVYELINELGISGYQEKFGYTSFDVTHRAVYLV